MHDSHVNTSKSKQQPNANSLGATLDSVPVEPATPGNPLNWQWSFFGADSYATGSTLRMAIEQLDDAYKTIGSIRAIAEILIANDCERGSDETGQPLRSDLAHGLKIGVHQLAKSLHIDLDGFEACLDIRRRHEQEQERIKQARQAQGGRHV